MIRLLAAALLLAAFIDLDAAHAADYYASSNGIAIYLGVVPAAIVRGHAPEHAETTMHRGVPKGRSEYHVMVGIFDAQTSERVTDAEVTASVQEIGLSVTTKRLEPMAIEETITYGNYFSMSGRAAYRIEVRVVRPGGTKPITASFRYSQPRR